MSVIDDICPRQRPERSICGRGGRDPAAMVRLGGMDRGSRALDEIAKRQYPPPIAGADWTVSAEDLIAVTLSIALGQHVTHWPGATDEQLSAVAKEVIAALDGRPMVQTTTALAERH